MRIELNEKYTLTSDNMNIFILEKKIATEKSKKKEDYEIVSFGYHQTLKNCLKSFVDRSVNKSGAESVEELVADIDEIKNTIEIFCDKIQSEINVLVAKELEKQKPKNKTKKEEK